VNDMEAIDAWVGALLARLTPARRLAVNRAVALELRRSQRQRIAAQRNPDGSPYKARAPQPKGLRERAGKIRRRSMFAKLRTVRNLKHSATADDLAVGFSGRSAQIAQAHQEGSVRKARSGQRFVTPARILIGLSNQDLELVQDTYLRLLASE